MFRVGATPCQVKKAKSESAQWKHRVRALAHPKTMSMCDLRVFGVARKSRN